MKVSIVVPLYNQQRYIKKCVQSISRQTYSDLEIIIVNDGSTDGSLAICQRLAAQDPRIRIIDKKNEGTAMARRDGYLAATGELLMFVDNDDELFENSVEILVDIMEKHGVDIAIGAYRHQFGWYSKDHRYTDLPNNQVITRPDLFDKYYISFFGVNILPVQVWGRVYRKSVVDETYAKVPLFSEKVRFHFDDEYFNVHLYPFLKSIYVTDQLVYVYRYGGITSHYNKYIPSIFPFFDERMNLLDKYGYDIGYKFLYIEYKNYLYTELQQRIEYKKGDKAEILGFIGEELRSRQMLPRLVAYFNAHPDECTADMRPFLHYEDAAAHEDIYSHALELARLNRKRFLAKKAFAAIQKIF